MRLVRLRLVILIWSSILASSEARCGVMDYFRATAVDAGVIHSTNLDVNPDLFTYQMIVATTEKQSEQWVSENLQTALSQGTLSPELTAVQTYVDELIVPNEETALTAFKELSLKSSIDDITGKIGNV